MIPAFRLYADNFAEKGKRGIGIVALYHWTDTFKPV